MKDAANIELKSELSYFFADSFSGSAWLSLQHSASIALLFFGHHLLQYVTSLAWSNLIGAPPSTSKKNRLLTILAILSLHMQKSSLGTRQSFDTDCNLNSPFIVVAMAVYIIYIALFCQPSWCSCNLMSLINHNSCCIILALRKIKPWGMGVSFRT